jgi:glycolate oxidase FAD binding subunit
LNWPDSDSSAAPLGDGRHAHALERPASVDELCDAVRRRAAEGLAIYPQGGRTSLDYGGIPQRPGVAIDTTGLNRVIDYPAGDMTITVEAGMTLAELAAVLDTESQRLEIDAPEPDRATIGGVFATNWTGPRRFGWGRPRDQIIGVGFVNGVGNLVKGGGRVVKNVAGYDFPRLLTGSMGTLGAISHVTLRAKPKPETTALAWYSIADEAMLAHDLERLNTSSTRPVAIELVSAARRLGIQDPGEGWTLAVGFEGSASSVAWQLDRVTAELSAKRVGSSEGAEASVLWRRLRDDIATAEGLVTIVANVPPSVVPRLAAAIDLGLWAFLAHAGNGVLRATSLDIDIDRIGADVHRLRALAEDSGGNLIVARCPTEQKESLKVWGNPRPDWGWNERVKAALDPGGVMNPGRFVGRI